MPDADGFEVLRAIRETDPGECVLFLTAPDAVEDRVQRRSARVDLRQVRRKSAARAKATRVGAQRRPTAKPAKAGVRRGPTRADADEIILTPQGSLVGSQYRPPSIPVIAGLRGVYLLPALSLYLRFRRSQRVREPGAPAALLVSQNLKDVGCRATGRARSCLGCFGRMSDAQHHLRVIGPSHEPLQPAAEGDQIHGLAQRATGQA